MASLTNITARSGAFFKKLKASTKALILAVVFGPISVTQLEQARDFCIPKLVHHPKLAGLAVAVFGLAILLHRPQVQKFLKHEPDGLPLVPAEPGAQIGDVKVVTEAEVEK